MVHRRTPSGTLYEDEDEEIGARVEKSAMLRVLLRLARFLVAATLLENGHRMFFGVDHQVKILTQVLPVFMARPYVHFSWAAQLVGGVAVAAGMEHPAGACVALSYLLSAIVIYGSLDAKYHFRMAFGRATYVCRMLCITGGVVASQAHAVSTGKRRREGTGTTLFAGASSSARGVESGVLIARLLGAVSSLSHIARIISEADSVLYTLLACGYALFAVALALGYSSELAAVALAVIVLVQNLAADRWFLAVAFEAAPSLTGKRAKGRANYRKTELATLRFYFLQDLAVFGALILLALLGPGKTSIDRALKKRRE